MEPRERPRDDRPRDPSPGGEGDNGLDQLRAEGSDFLAASDEAIRRALSGDSEAFLRATPQRGGE